MSIHLGLGAMACHKGLAQPIKVVEEQRDGLALIVVKFQLNGFYNNDSALLLKRLQVLG
jgi:hypothetical protein